MLNWVSDVCQRSDILLGCLSLGEHGHADDQQHTHQQAGDHHRPRDADGRPTVAAGRLPLLHGHVAALWTLQTISRHGNLLVEPHYYLFIGRCQYKKTAHAAYKLK